MYGEYTCLDCGETFDEPKKWIEQHGLDSPPYEKFSGCPFCGGSYTQTILCDGCGCPIIGDYVQIQVTGSRYCDERAKAVAKYFIACGIDPNRLITVGNGNTKMLVDPGASDAYLNRRTDVFFKIIEE